MISIPDGWRTQLPWATWSYPNRWLPASIYDDDLAFQRISAYTQYWRANMETLATSKGSVEHILLTVGLISRDIYSYQFANQDPDDVDTTPSYCNSDNLNMDYHDTLMKLVSDVYERARKGPTGKMF